MRIAHSTPKAAEVPGAARGLAGQLAEVVSGLSQFFVRPRSSEGLLVPLALFAIISSAASLRGATITWDGSSADGLWATTANWSSGALPGTADTANFDSDLSVAPWTITLGADRAVQVVTFSSGAATQGFTFSGANMLTVGATGTGGITNNDADTQTFNSTVRLGATQTWDAASGALAFSAVTLTNSGTARTLTVQGAFGTSISGVMSNGAGTGSLTKTGTGTLTLSGTNTYTGVTTINQGAVSVATIGNGGVAGNLGQATNAAGNLVLGGGTLQYTGATASTNRNFTLTAGTTSTIDVTTNDLTISGASTNTTGALPKTGAG
jgi:fibronectin-binding autotransporter adhesin